MKTIKEAKIEVAIAELKDYFHALEVEGVFSTQAMFHNDFEYLAKTLVEALENEEIEQGERMHELSLEQGLDV